MQLLLQTLMPQTSSQLLYSTRRLLLNKCKTTQLIYIELYELIQPCHNRIQTPHHNHVQGNQVGEITMHPQFYTLPNVSHTPQSKQKLHQCMLLLTRTLDSCNLDQAPSLIRSALQLCNEETMHVSERKELSQVSLLVESRT